MFLGMLSKAQLNLLSCGSVLYLLVYGKCELEFVFSLQTIMSKSSKRVALLYDEIMRTCIQARQR